MKTLVVMLVILLSSVAVGVERPPEPNDMPDYFEYDPNMRPLDDRDRVSLVFKWLETDIGTPVIINFRIKNKFGADVNDVFLWDVNGVPERTPFHVIQKIEETDEVYGTVWVQRVNFYWTPLRPGLHYLQLKVFDSNGDWDQRTLLMYVTVDDPPVIFSHDDPVITNGAKQLLQRRKKLGFFFGSPIHVRL